MVQLYFEFFHWVDSVNLWGVPLDVVFHFAVSFTLYWVLRRLIGFRNIWCILFIVGIGLVKEWTDKSAVYNSGKFEEPFKDMAVNCFGILIGYLLYRRKKLSKLL